MWERRLADLQRDDPGWAGLCTSGAGARSKKWRLKPWRQTDGRRPVRTEVVKCGQYIWSVGCKRSDGYPVTDGATLGSLHDVGDGTPRGLSRSEFGVRSAHERPEARCIQRTALRTGDAHDLRWRDGLTLVSTPDHWMALLPNSPTLPWVHD